MRKLPKVGVAIILKNNLGEVLFGLRYHGKDRLWSLPSGHLEFGEDIFDCAKREIFEEAGIKIKNLSIGPITNDIFRAEKQHYVSIYVYADIASGRPKAKEPNKITEWRWLDYDNLPQNIMLSVKNLKRHHPTL